MSTPTPETLAERRALWTELRDRGGQDVILTPEFALALLDALAAEKAAREADLTACRSPYWREKYEIEKARADKDEQERQIAENREMRFMLERDALRIRLADLRALVARIEALADKWEAEAKRACGDTSHYGYSACPDCGSAGYAAALRALTEKEQD